MVAIVESMFLIIVATVSFVITVLVIPKQITFMKRINWVGHDIHKQARPEVAESGGISVLAGCIVGLVLTLIFFQHYILETVCLLVSIVCAAAIGFVDDRLRLSAFKKIASVIVAAVPMTVLYMFSGLINSNPPVPFLGYLQVTILYLPFIPGFLAVLMNAVNMYEGYNGQGSGTSIVVTVSLIVSALVTGSDIALVLSIPLLFTLVAFFIYNRFPARIFPGDIGTLLVGMYLGCIAIFGSLEFVLIVSIVPHVFNAFHVIRSVRGFKESHDIKIKDIELVEGDLIRASTQANAPMTIPRIVVAKAPLNEAKLVKNLIFLNLIPSSLSILSAALIKATVQENFLDPLLLGIAVIVAAVTVLATLLMKPIRWLNVAFFLVYAGLIVLLVFIDLFVVGLGFFNWLVAGGLALAGLLAWYYLFMKYFTRITSKPGNTPKNNDAS